MGVKIKYIDAFKNKNGLRPEASLIHRFTIKQFTVNIIIIMKKTHSQIALQSLV